MVVVLFHYQHIRLVQPEYFKHFLNWPIMDGIFHNDLTCFIQFAWKDFSNLLVRIGFKFFALANVRKYYRDFSFTTQIIQTCMKIELNQTKLFCFDHRFFECFWFLWIIFFKDFYPQIWAAFWNIIKFHERGVVQSIRSGNVETVISWFNGVLLGAINSAWNCN